MPHLHSFANLAIASFLPLPELPETSAHAVEWRITEAAQPLLPRSPLHWSHDWRDAAGRVTLSGARCGDACFLRFPGLAEARLDAEGVALWSAPGAGAESVRHVLVDQILPRVLAHHGHLMLHGGAVASADDGGCIVVLGESGRGKSTLSATLAAQDGRLLSDDCLRVDLDRGHARAVASYPGLRLLPDSLVALYGPRAPATSALAGHTDKRRLTTAATALPTPAIGAIFVLEAPGSGRDIRVEPLPPQRACIELVRNAFQLDLGDMARMRTQLALAARVARDVPVYALSYPREYALLPRVAERIRRLARHGAAADRAS